MLTWHQVPLLFLSAGAIACNYPRAEQGMLLVGYPHPVLATSGSFSAKTSLISAAPSLPSLSAGAGLDFSLASQGVCLVSPDPCSQQTLDLVVRVCLNLPHRSRLVRSIEKPNRLKWMGKPALSSSSCNLFPWLET